jgi:hypothetical protein
MKYCLLVPEVLLIVVVLSLVFGLAIPDKDDHKTRPKTVDSDDSHYGGGGERVHNADYDHKAFLGEDAEEFDQLSPEESKERLSKMVDRIDKNGDGFVTAEELKDWIHISQKKYIVDDVERQWKTQTADDESVTALSLDDYKKRTFGFLDELADNTVSTDDSNTYREMLK